MDANAYLAEHLMGWKPSKHDIPYWFDDKGCMGSSNWHPDTDDAQADMVVRKMATGGYHWCIDTKINPAGELRYRVLLWGPAESSSLIYDEYSTPNRNEHIVKAAVAALEAEKPEPHRCKGMPAGCEWSYKDGEWGFWIDLCIKAPRYLITGCFCHKCGADLNEHTGTKEKR